MLKTSIANRRLFCIAMTAVLAGGQTTFAQPSSAFPGDKVIKLIAPFPPGGQIDSEARLLAHHLSKELNTSIVVENIAGAAGAVGMARAARAEPNGYTVVIGFTAANSIAPALNPSLSYKPKDDFVPVGKIGDAPLVIVATPNFPANNMQDLLAMARKQDGKMLYAAWGIGSGGHLIMEGINQHAKLAMQQVPYKGEAAIHLALQSGEMPLGVASLGGSLPFIKSGKLKALGVTGTKRAELKSDIPTVAEQGIPMNITAWHGMFVPAKTPASVVEVLSQALSRTIARPEVKEKLRDIGVEASSDSRDQFIRFIDEDAAAWKKIIVTGNIKAD